MSSVLDSKETEAYSEDQFLVIMDCSDGKSESWKYQKTVREMQHYVDLLECIYIFILFILY